MHTMRRTYIAWLAALLSAIVLPGAHAQQTDSLYLTLEQLFELGMEHDLRLAADRLDERICDERARTARARRLPDIDVGLNGGYVGQPVVFERGLSGATRPESPDWSQNYTLNLSQPLYHGGRIRTAIGQADLEREAARLRTETDASDIKLALLGQYLRLFSLYKQRVVLRRNISESERRLKDIRQMKEEGLITNNDVLRSEMQLTNDRLSLLETENDLRLASQELDVQLGLDEGLLLCPDTSLLERAFGLLTCDEYIALAYEGDPDMRLRAKRTELARKGVEAARAELRPSLSLYAANTLARPVSRTLADMYNNAWNVGLSVSYPLSALYRERHRVNEARQHVRLEQNAEEQHRQQLRNNVRNAYLKHYEARERVKALELSVRQAEENYRIMRNRYLGQLAILTDLLDADNLRLDAELRLTTARTQVVYTYYRLQRAIGRL